MVGAKETDLCLGSRFQGIGQWRFFVDILQVNIALPDPRIEVAPKFRNAVVEWFPENAIEHLVGHIMAAGQFRFAFIGDLDRKGVVKGKGVSVRVDLGVRRDNKKKKKK